MFRWVIWQKCPDVSDDTAPSIIRVRETLIHFYPTVRRNIL
jgi:hypothetical protein